ncbi:hypothetical protein NE686_13225 [Tissierella carlieri]|uniref:Lipoprotein n=1 Tax=Tissierella carlieri TaxID=689904 RepID=A0ABT1SC45_9FIRM|nr:hypothetical protein [Tissierella carlieri]MCQ4924057.1 hypothetical protein [Tissierella carlieri]
MWKKSIKFIVLLLCLTIFTMACSKKESLPTALSLEQSIKEIIISKGANYDFLTDTAYMEHMDKLGAELTNDHKSPHYAIGNLDEDSIPELAVFKERDPKDINDEGSLEIYKFNGEKYTSIDKISMNYDNTNYQIVIGKISEEQNGLLLNNQVGAHSGLTYGFILKDGKLKSIFNENKISLLSIYTDNEIKDINDDGILEFSIYITDPETKDSTVSSSDKMTLWYRWDGKDSATLLEVERKDYSKDESDKEIFNEAKDLIENNLAEALKYMDKHKDELSKYDNTELLMKYMKILDEMSFDEGVEIENLFIKYQNNENFDYLFKKYGLSIEKLNSLEYLTREKVLKDEEELKKHLIDHITLGYKLDTSEGIYYYLIDNQKFVDTFGQNITNEYNDYLKILALDTNEPFMNDGSLMISMDKLAERILLVESFKMVYPYSNLLPKVDELYKWYIYTYFYGDNHTPNFNENTLIMKEEVLKEFENAIGKYEYTNFADIIREFMENLKQNNNVINDEIRVKLDERLN